MRFVNWMKRKDTKTQRSFFALCVFAFWGASRVGFSAWGTLRFAHATIYDVVLRFSSSATTRSATSLSA
jgi:hypothetical protein